MPLPWKVRKNRVDKDWAFLKEKIDLGLSLRRAFEGQWILNMAFISGRQYSYFNTSSHTLHQLTPEVGQFFATDNIILPKWVRQISDFIKTRPKMTVVPNSNQEEDIDAARLGSKILEDYYTRKFLKAKARQLAVWVKSTGSGFLSDYWNKKAGPWAMDRKTGKIVYAGDVDCSVWSPFNVIVPTYNEVTTLNEMDWVILRQRKSLEWIRANLKGGEQVVAEDINPNAIALEQLFAQHTASAALGNVPSAYMIIAYFKPCERFPKGAFIRAANGVVEPIVDWPYLEYPIEHFKDLDMPNQFWGDCRVTHAIPLQVRWNKCISSVSEFNQEVAKVKIATPRRSNLDINVDNKHREIVTYSPVLGHKPEFMTPYTLSPSIEREQEWIQFSLENLFSQHEVTRGTNKSDIRSGDMVELLLEQDTHGEIPSHFILEEAFEAHGARILLRVQQGYTQERIIKLGNTEDEFEIISFKGADLRNNRDVKVIKESSLPDSKHARSLQIERRYEKGLLGDPRDPKVRRRVLRMLDDSIVDDIYSDYKKDELLARWENHQFMQGKPLPINPYDNHAVHVEEHDRLRKSLRFQRLKVEDPNAFTQFNMLIQAHVAAHQRFINEEMKKQLQIMQMQGGGKNG